MFLRNFEYKTMSRRRNVPEGTKSGLAKAIRILIPLLSGPDVREQLFIVRFVFRAATFVGWCCTRGWRGGAGATIDGRAGQQSARSRDDDFQPRHRFRQRRPGAEVKIDTFDLTRYGPLQGKVVIVSRTPSSGKSRARRPARRSRRSVVGFERAGRAGTALFHPNSARLNPADADRGQAGQSGARHGVTVDQGRDARADRIY
jgi:hypothetical protein